MIRQAMKLTEDLTNFDYLRRPIKASARESGAIPYLGASGQVDTVASFTHDGAYLCVSEDGENLRSRKTPIAWVQQGKFWANNHLHVLGGVSVSRLRFFAGALAWLDVSGYITGSAQPKLSQASLDRIEIPYFSANEQKAIGEILGALDDKIAANRRIIETGESLGDALFSSAARAASDSTPAGTYFDLAYGRALPTAVRKDGPVPVYGSGGIVGRHDTSLFGGPGVIVGRKGSVGTVYWAEDGAFPIDTTFFVRPHGIPHAFAYLLLKRMRLPLMAADSAVPGLNRARVLQEFVPALSQADAHRLAAQVSPLFTKIHQLERENTALARTRDELLPLLMSGRITVKDAEKRVQEEV